MKNHRKRTVSLCLTVCLLWGLLGGGVSAAETGISLENAEIEVQTKTYTGNPVVPGVRVKINGETLQQGREYTVVFENNVDAGEGTGKAIITGEGSYSGIQTVSFTISPAKLTESAIQIKSCIKEYDGTTTANPTFSVHPTNSADTVEVLCDAAYDDQYAGSKKVVTASNFRFGGPDGHNYVLENPELKVTYSSGQIMAREPDLPKVVEVLQGEEKDLKTVIPEPWQEGAAFSVDSEAQEDAAQLGCRLDGALLTAGEETGSFLVNVTLSSVDLNGDGQAEYDNAAKALRIHVVERASQPPVSGGEGDDPSQQQAFTLTGPKEMTYGQSVQMTAAGGAGTGQVTYWVTTRGARGQAVIDSQGKLTATQAGTVLVYAEKAGDDRYQDAKADPVEVTIHPAQLTVQVHDKTALVGQEVPVLGKEDYTVSGLVGEDVLTTEPTLSYASPPDMSQPGQTAIQAAGAAAPAGGNYSSQITYQPGTLTIQAVPVYPVTLTPADHGTVTASCQQAASGTEVILTVVPEEGFFLEKMTASSAAGLLTLWQGEDGTYSFVMPEEEVTVTAVFAQEIPAPEPLPFLDVREDDWYYEDVGYVYRLGLMEGTGMGLFSPNGTTTRGMLVTILYRMEGVEAGTGWTPFQDVETDAYYSAPVGWAAWNGIVSGYEDDTFRPNDRITREQLAVILYRYGCYKEWTMSQQGDLYQFSDWESCHDYAWTALSWAVEAGLVQGKEMNRLDPLGQATRAQVAAILHRFHQTFLAEPET